MARTSKYETEILPYLNEIRQAVESGATVEEIADAFDIATSTLYRYKNEKEELKKAFMRGRKQICFQIKGALLKKALGYDYNESRTTAKKDKDGESIVMVENYIRHQPPSETACAMLLRNYEKDWLDKDAVSTDLKKQEMDLRKAIAESNNFDLNLGD